MHGILLWLHILAAATWIGAAVAVLFLAPRMAVSAVSGKAFALQWVEMGRKLFTPAAIIALATGIGLVISDEHSFSSAFVSAGFLMVIIGGVLGARVYAPMGREIAAIHEAGGDPSGLYSRMRTLGVAELALLAFTVYAMAVRLGA